MPNRPRRPLDGWDPYGDRRPERRNRWAFPRIARLSIPAFFALFAIGHDVWRLFEPTSAPQSIVTGDTTSFGSRPLPAARPIPADPRHILPRGARPVESPASWFTSDDYPTSALRENLAGNVNFRFTVDPDGRVRTCTPIASSGSPLLDETACGVFAQHARYWPARDREGHAISSIQTQSVRWQIPKD